MRVYVVLDVVISVLYPGPGPGSPGGGGGTP